MIRKKLIERLQGLEDMGRGIYQDVSDNVAEDFKADFVTDELEIINRNIYDLWRNLADMEDLK